ncbi:MAG: protein translocase subunit SecF [Chloroflexota bacterium]
MNIIKNRYLYFFISLVIIIPGLVFMGIHWVQHPDIGPIPLGIDFRGGSLFEVQFEGARPSVDQMAELYADFSTAAAPIADPVIQPLGEDAYSIRSRKIDESVKTQMVAEMESRFGVKVTVLNFTAVSPAVGAEVAKAASIAILFAAAAILFYIWWAFRAVEHPVRYGTAAIVAMLHDVLVVLGVEAMLGYFFGWEADALFLTALLTVIGFSVHDTIVVFDRVRENSHIFRRLNYETLVNHSIVQTLDRSISTQLTVMFTLTALVLFGGDSIRHFVVILLVGIFSGTYSSIFNAAPLLVVWENREWQTWFKKKDELAPLP